MIYRSFNPDKVLETLHSFEYDFNAKEWLEDERNIALTDGDGSFCLFEYNSPGVYTGHYFLVRKGKEAMELLYEVGNEIFREDCYEVRIIKGLTPLEKLGARWMNKQMGFKSHGAVTTVLGPCELVTLTKEDWDNKNHGQ